MARIVVSSCLLGCPCRYKGDSRPCDWVIELAKENEIIPICPEQFGGLTTPRNPSEISGDKVFMSDGTDVTDNYRRGAEMALHLAELGRADFAVLKAGSPSCGKGRIYDGTFSGRKIDGDGVTVRLFREHGIPVISEEEPEKLEELL